MAAMNLSAADHSSSGRVVALVTDQIVPGVVGGNSRTCSQHCTSRHALLNMSAIKRWTWNVNIADMVAGWRRPRYVVRLAMILLRYAE